MHIGLLIYGSLENRSGGYLYDRMLVQSLRGGGDLVEVISMTEANYLRHIADNLSPGLIDQLSDLNIDLLLQDELNHPSLFFTNYSLRKRINYPLVSIVHHLRSSETHPSLLNWIYQKIERRYLRSLDGFIFNSLTTRKVVEDLVGDGFASIVAYPAGDRLGDELQREAILSRVRQEGPLKILFLGNVIPRKGLELLLTALASIPPNRWSLKVVGSLTIDPSHTSSMKRLVRNKGFDHQVKFTGFLEAEALKALMVDSQVLVVPSDYEGFGISYLEGMGFGLPAIATTAGGAAEIISDGENGYLIAPGDTNRLAELLKQLMSDRELLVRMSLSARERYLCHPTWEETTIKIRSFLLKMVESKGIK